MLANWRLWFGLAVSLLCMALAARGIDPNQVLASLRDVDYLWLIPAALSGVLSVWFKALRWRVLFRPRYSPPTTRLFSITMVGYVVNSVLPARLGDPARAVLAGESLGLRTAQALSTIVVERLLDILTVLVFLFALLPFIGIPAWLVPSAALVGTLAIVGLFGLLLAGRARGRVLPWLERLAGRLPAVVSRRVLDQVEQLLCGTDALFDKRNLAWIGGYSLIIWLLAVVQNYTAVLAFALPVPPAAAALVLVVNALGMVIPSSPGYIGVFHYLTVLVLSLFGVEASLALSFAVLLHLVTFVPLVALGSMAMWHESISLARVSTRAARLGQ
ncbi:MAG: lysylphosphatidylglycerol synthase transmembrane domain-containing protein [Chloroflexota bacterium]